jgi:hypothetical protein
LDLFDRLAIALQVDHQWRTSSEAGNDKTGSIEVCEKSNKLLGEINAVVDEEVVCRG